MSFKTFALAALLGFATASPLTPQVLQHDDVLLLRDGKATVMKSWDYTLEEDKRQVQQRREARAAPKVRAEKRNNDLEARCEESTEVQVLTDTHFNNWDVAMSPVVGNTGSSDASIAVAEGYSIADSVSVSSIFVPFKLAFYTKTVD